MTSAREPKHEPEPAPVDETAVSPVEPADCVKPVELIELLQQRTAKRRQIKAPTSSPFYDVEFVASHPTKRRRRRSRD